MTVPTIKVDGESIRSLQKALKAVGTGLAKTLRSELKSAAAIVSMDAKLRVPSRTGRAAASIGSGATAKGAYVQGGKGRVGYYGWLDFGSRNPVRGNPRSVGPWAGSGKGPAKGRFIYPALHDKWDVVVDAVQSAVDKSIREAGF